jgi:hypothetical protein
MVRWIALLALAAVAFAALPAAAQASGSGVERLATLHGSAAFPGADGKARFRDRGGERELEVEVEDANRLAGARLRVFVGDQQAGSLRINRFGNGALNLNSDRGDTVPAVKAGTTVRVGTAGGTLVVSGSF